MAGIPQRLSDQWSHLLAGAPQLLDDRHLHLMKTTIVVLFSGLSLCCYAQEQPTRAHEAIDLVQSGKDLVWHSGKGGYYTLHVTQRQSDSIQGVWLSTEAPDGTETKITAKTGTVAEGPDRQCVRISLYDVTTQNSKAGLVTQTSRSQEASMVLRIPGK